jgi:hypothetical protein
MFPQNYCKGTHYFMIYKKNTAYNLAVSGKDATFAHWIRPQYLGVDWI